MIEERVKYHDLTEKQGNIYDWMREFNRMHGFSPSIREICAAFGIRSPNGAKGHVDALEMKGYISRSGCQARAIVYLQEPNWSCRARGRHVLVNSVPANMTAQEAVRLGRELIKCGEQALAFRSSGGGSETEAGGSSEAPQPTFAEHLQGEHTSAGTV